MKAAQTSTRTISLAGRRLETTKASADPSTIASNARAAREFLDSAAARGERHRLNGAKWGEFDAVPRQIVADFLKAYTPSSTDPFFSDGVLARWVESARSPHLQTWRAVVVSGSGPPQEISGLDVALVRRHIENYGDGELRISGSSSRLAGSTDVERVLPAAVRERALKEWEAEPGRSRSETWFYRYLPSPLIMIYPLEPGEKSEDARRVLTKSGEKFICAVKVAIPGASESVRDSSTDVKYVINSVAKRLWSPELTDEDGDEIG